MQDTPKDLDKKRADEKLLVSEMIALYCRRQHNNGRCTGRHSRHCKRTADEQRGLGNRKEALQTKKILRYIRQ